MMMMVDIVLGPAGFPSAAAFEAFCAWLSRRDAPFYVDNIAARSWHEGGANAYYGRSDDIIARASEWLMAERDAFDEAQAEAA